MAVFPPARGIVTAAQEKAAKRAAELEKPFKATHVYNPSIIDATAHVDVQPGEHVQLLREHTRAIQMRGSPQIFKMVRNAGGAVGSVHRNSLRSVNQPNPDDAMSWSPSASDAEMEAWKGVFNDRRQR